MVPPTRDLAKKERKEELKGGRKERRKGRCKGGERGALAEKKKGSREEKSEKVLDTGFRLYLLFSLALRLF